jgi:hypothetical protein
MALSPSLTLAEKGRLRIVPAHCDVPWVKAVGGFRLPKWLAFADLSVVVDLAGMTKQSQAAHQADLAPEEQRLTTLELFFDLVFVFTLTQLSALLSASLSWVGLLHSFLIFIILF